MRAEPVVDDGHEGSGVDCLPEPRGVALNRPGFLLLPPMAEANGHDDQSERVTPGGFCSIDGMINPIYLREEDISLSQQTDLRHAQQINRKSKQQSFSGKNERKSFDCGVVPGHGQPDRHGRSGCVGRFPTQFCRS